MREGENLKIRFSGSVEDFFFIAVERFLADGSSTFAFQDFPHTDSLSTVSMVSLASAFQDFFQAK